MSVKLICCAFAVMLFVVSATAPVCAQTTVARSDASPDAASAPQQQVKGPNLTRVFAESFSLLMIEHGTRVAFQDQTRRDLAGPFFKDYRRSIRKPTRWEDGDPWFVNYVGHPIHGAAAGFVWLEHDPRSQREEFGINVHYWSTRWRPVLFSALYSIQFEIGPISEASIGNLGLRPDTRGWIDFVVTPTGAMALLVAEDAVDRFFIRWAEAHTTNRFYRASLRMIFNPSRTLANLAGARAPWHRGTRTIDWMKDPTQTRASSSGGLMRRNEP